MAGEGEVLSLLELESSLEMHETCLQGPGHPPFGPWDDLQQLNKDFQKFSPLSSQQEALQCAGKRGAGEEAKSSTS